MNNCFCIIKFKNINDIQGIILCYNISYSQIKRIFEIITTGSENYIYINKGLYCIIKCNKQYIENLGMSMRASDLDFTLGQFNETILESKLI